MSRMQKDKDIPIPWKHGNQLCVDSQININILISQEYRLHHISHLPTRYTKTNQSSWVENTVNDNYPIDFNASPSKQLAEASTRSAMMWQHTFPMLWSFRVFVCVAANMQFEPGWNQEVAREKDPCLNQQVSPIEKQQGIPNNTIPQNK